MERKEFEILSSRLRPAIYETARKVTGSEDDAEDVAQDTLLKLWCMRERLDEYRSVEALSMVISRRMSIDRLRQNRGISLEDIEQHEESPSPEEALMHDEAETETDRLLAILPDREQAVMRMKHIDGMETSEIAAIIGTSEVSVRVALSRGRRRIKDLFLTQKNKLNYG